MTAEHEARCDLMDALHYIKILWGGYGEYVTAAEKTTAKEFWAAMNTKYPKRKAP